METYRNEKDNRVLEKINDISSDMPMFVRRHMMELQAGSAEAATVSETPDGTPIPVTGTSLRLPQIQWDLILTDEERANRDAMREDIASMRDVSPVNIFEWPTLPYPIGEWYSEERFLDLARTIDCVYNDEPELSVYTNGQSLCACATLSTYNLIDANKDTQEENRREYDEVVAAADALHAEIESEMAGRESATWPRPCDSDEMYVILLYERLGSRTTYSDDEGDTKHANDIYGALIEDESKCYGVACAAKALLNRRGIPSFIASGSADGNDDTRHAWVMLWIGGQWKVLDLTSAQGWAPPDVINVDDATMGAGGYWNGCMKPFEKFVENWGMAVDEDCLRLMGAYEASIGATGGVVCDK